MKNQPLSERVLQFRKSQGLSQEELAENAKVNLRTIQRIESGETEPRGNTLRQLAKALNRPLEDFLDYSKEEDKSFLHLLNLSALTYWVLPLGNIIVPLILWQMKKDKVKGAGELGRRLLNFQITWSVLTNLLFIGGAFFKIMHWSGGWSMLIAALVLYGANAVMILYSSWQIKHGSGTIYPLGVRLLR